MAKLLNQKEYSIMRGCSQQYISKLIGKGYLDGALVKQGNRTLIDPIKAEKLLEDHFGPQNPDQNKPVKTAPPTDEQWQVLDEKGVDLTISTAEAQRRRAVYEAELKRLELEEKQGTLIEKETVRKDVFELARRTRDSLLSIPDRLAHELAACSDRHVVREKLTAEITTALTELPNKNEEEE